MVNVTIYFHHSGDWVKHPEIFYEKGLVHCWNEYDPDLLSFIDLENEYTSKLCFLGVQQLIVLGPSGKYFKIQGDDGIRKLLSFVFEDFHSIHLFTTDDCELFVDVLDIIIHSSSFLSVSIVGEAGTNCSDNEMEFSYSEYETDELEDFVKKRK